MNFTCSQKFSPQEQEKKGISTMQFELDKSTE